MVDTYWVARPKMYTERKWSRLKTVINSQLAQRFRKFVFYSSVIMDCMDLHVIHLVRLENSVELESMALKMAKLDKMIVLSIILIEFSIDISQQICPPINSARLLNGRAVLSRSKAMFSLSLLFVSLFTWFLTVKLKISMHMWWPFKKSYYVR